MKSYFGAFLVLLSLVEFSTQMSHEGNDTNVRAGKGYTRISAQLFML
jgi:hypothetical protein